MHQSWLIAIMCAGFVVGIVASQWLLLPYAIYLVIIGASGAIFCLWRHRVYVILIALICGCCLGLGRGVPDVLQRQMYAPLYGTKQTIQAVVVDDPQSDSRGGMALKVGNIVWNNRTMAGTVRVTTVTKMVIKRYDKVALTGKLSPGFGTFVATINSAAVNEVKRTQSGDIAGDVRNTFSEKIRSTVAEPQASLGIGYLVGQKSDLPSDLGDAFRIAGLTHVVVASGYNLTILVRLARRLFVKVSKYLAAFASFAMIGGFIAVTGVSPSMSRAGLVASLGILAWYYGRKFHPIILLSLVAALTLAINPSYAWGDLGWQLSFLAFAGVMIVAPLLQRYFFGDAKPSTLRQIFGETLCAQIVTAPVIVMAFGQLSIVAIIANMLILPLVPIAMLLTFIAGAGAFMPFVAGVIGIPATFLLKYMTETSQFVASFSWSQINVTMNGYAAALYYCLLIAGCVFMWVKTRLNLRSANLVE